MFKHLQTIDCVVLALLLLFIVAPAFAAPPPPAANYGYTPNRGESERFLHELRERREEKREQTEAEIVAEFLRRHPIKTPTAEEQPLPDRLLNPVAVVLLSVAICLAAFGLTMIAGVAHAVVFSDRLPLGLLASGFAVVTAAVLDSLLFACIFF